MLEARRRIAFRQSARGWLLAALAQPRMLLLPLEPEIGWLASNLAEDFHGDPADRMIVATALHHGAPLATADAAIRNSRQVALA